MSHRTEARVVCASTTEFGPQTDLYSIYMIFPKAILGEVNTHRALSRSDRSSRAVPSKILIEEVRTDPFMPAVFRHAGKGMVGGEPMTDYDLREAATRQIVKALTAADAAEYDLICGEAKGTANRALDPFIRMHSLRTGTRNGWLNLLGLRLDKGADDNFQVLANKIYEAIKTGPKPKLLKPGEWHLPFIDEEDYNTVRAMEPPLGKALDLHYDYSEVMRQWSAARCAHLSYHDLETGQRMTVERAMMICAKLRDSRPLHSSPFEHQATPDEWLRDTRFHEPANVGDWKYGQNGNLSPGWRQYRKMIPNESVANLPEGYEL